MALLTEIAEGNEVLSYEIERNKPMPSLNHSIVQGNLIAELKVRYRKQYTILSEIDLTMPEKPNAVPDVAIYPKLKIDFLEDKVTMKEMPLVTIEILSPSQNENEMVAKAQRYFIAGVKSCWIVLPIFKAIVIFSSPTQRQVFTEDMLLVDKVAGIEFNVSEVFAD
jgi:Uma2 family endonuclease